MPRSLTETQRDTIKAMLKEDRPQIDIALAVNCSVRQVQRVKRNMSQWGTPNAPKLVNQGRPHSLNEAQLDVYSFTNYTISFVIANS